MTKEELVKKFTCLTTRNGGLESFVSQDSPKEVIERLCSVDKAPLSKVQLNQLLGLCEERAVSDGFFKYYWLSEPKSPYKLSKIPGYSEQFSKSDEIHGRIQSIDHLYYGIYRIYIDGLLLRGNVRSYYRENASKSYDEIQCGIQRMLIDTNSIKLRGPFLSLKEISKDNRYLISEMACKSYGETPEAQSDLKEALLDSWKKHKDSGGGAVTIGALLAKDNFKNTKHSSKQGIFKFAADDILDEEVTSEEDIEERYERIAKAFLSAREASPSEHPSIPFDGK